jgi:hypothetical protein
MTTLSPCCAAIAPPRRWRLLRWASDLNAALARSRRRWVEVGRMHAEQRALGALPDSTLRDIGLAERRHEAPTSGQLGWRYGRWQ